jgi:hypothetical protein
MQDKTGSREAKETRETIKEQERTLEQITEQAIRNCEQAFRICLRWQQEAVGLGECFADRGGSTEDWQKRYTSFNPLAHTLQPAQKRVEEVLDLMEKNTHTSADLLKKATEAAQTPGVSERQAKWANVWTSSLGAMRSNAEAMLQIGTRATESWIDFVQKNAELARPRNARAA